MLRNPGKYIGNVNPFTIENWIKLTYTYGRLLIAKNAVNLFNAQNLKFIYLIDNNQD